jgi:uncharacterized membrane protein YdjX (TVP38/TMEM64 family)
MDTKAKKRNKVYIFLAILIVLLVLGYFISPYLQMESLIELRDSLRNFVQNNFYLSIFMFLVAMIFLINSPISLVGPLGTLGGLLYGFYMGFIVNFICIFIACLVGFFLARYLLTDSISSWIEKRTPEFTKDFMKKPILYIASMRIIPIIPYFIVNYFSGISKLSIKKYVLGSVVGFIPTFLFYSYLGDILSTIKTLDEFWGKEFIIILVLVSIVFLLPLFFKDMFIKVKKKPIHP